MINEVTVKMIVTGTVQGVGFRWATRQAAIKLQIAGYAKNLYNGQVKIVAQGKHANLMHFIKIIKASPTPYGHVNKVKIQKIHRIPYSLFIVR